MPESITNDQELYQAMGRIDERTQHIQEKVDRMEGDVATKRELESLEKRVEKNETKIWTAVWSALVGLATGAVALLVSLFKGA